MIMDSTDLSDLPGDGYGTIDDDSRFAVSASGLAKSFGKLRVLDGLSVAIPRGTTYCLLGPNGSGKTTLIRAIVGLLKLDGGDMQVLGTPVSSAREIYGRIGYMTQHRALYPDLTLQENMEFFSGLYGVVGSRRRERIDELLSMVELTAHRNRLAGDLSGGMYQRLSLACTLIHEPELLLLDEPTVGVDPMLRQVFWDYFDELAEEGRTIIITTHLMDEAERCRIVGFMRAGRMLAEAGPEDLKLLAGLRPVLDLRVADAERSAESLREMGFSVETAGGDRVRISLDKRSQVKEILQSQELLDLRIEEPSLGDAFMRLSSRGEIP